MNGLPHVRPNNRSGSSKRAIKESKEMDALSQIINIQEISPDRLLSAKK